MASRTLAFVRTKPPTISVPIPLYEYGFEVLVGIFVFLLVVLVGYQSGGCKKVQQEEKEETEARQELQGYK